MVAGVMRRLYRERLQPRGVKWSKLDPTTIAFYWGEFQVLICLIIYLKYFISYVCGLIFMISLILQKRFFWRDIPESEVYAAWKSHAATTYRQYISRLKHSAPLRPSSISEAVWAEFMEYWESEATVAESRRNSANRNRGDRVTWHGGSVSTATHSRRLVSNF